MISSRPAFPSRTTHRPGSRSLPDMIVWLVSHLFSFETLFTGFLYSNAYKQLLPPLPADETVIFAALCIPVAIWIILRDGLYIPGLHTTVAFFVFVGWVVVTYSWTPSQVLAKESITYLVTFGVLSVVSGACVIAPSRERTVRFLVAILIASLVLSVYGSIIYIQYGTFRFYEGFVQRTYLLWGHAAAGGAVIAFAIAIYSKFGTPKQVIVGGIFLIMAYFLMIATSRGALLSLAGACFLPLLISRAVIRERYFGLPQWLFALILFIVILIAYSVHVLISGEQLGTFGRFIKLFNQVDNPDLVLSANRFAYFQAAVAQWLENPILGGGVNSFTIYFSGREIGGTIPHNLFLELLSQYGLVGTVIFAIFAFTGLRHATLTRLREDPLLLCVLMMFTGRLIGTMFGKDLPFQHPLLACMGLLCLRPPPQARFRTQVRRVSVERRQAAA
ncbi:MAG: O-antigen ligase family protein [Geminicoccaceae bacterium]